MQKNDKSDSYKFYCEQTVRVTHGFFKGQIAKIVGCHIVPFNWLPRRFTKIYYLLSNTEINEYNDQIFHPDILEDAEYLICKEKR